MFTHIHFYSPAKTRGASDKPIISMLFSNHLKYSNMGLCKLYLSQNENT